LTMLSIATYYGTVISQQTSASAQESTQSFYYAETGLNYVAWALKNDAELDGYDPTARQDRYGAVTLNAFAVGDRREWEANKGNPSNQQKIQRIFQGDTAPFVDAYGQLGYFDNRNLYSRPVGLLGSLAAGSDTYAFGVLGSPVFHDIYTQLSGYIRLDIDGYGQITPSFSPYAQHGNNTHVCNGQTVGDVPCNGAIVWLAAGDPYTDRVLYPIDPYVAAPLLDKYGSAFVLNAPQLPLGSVIRALSTPVDVYSNGVVKTMADPFPSAFYQNLPCNLAAFPLDTYTACDQSTGNWLVGEKYGLVVYAIGYSGGKARKMIRMVIN